ncbi:MAG: hypothetical protein M1834_002622 [Cirrosporium novae-zelandiae]|nr:MAG: hypothetical protein M1834_002622 [Cirrosporium novae-zelandiae]
MSSTGLLGSVILALLPHLAHATYNIDSSFKVDVHSHVVPDVWREALISAGYTVTDGTLYTDGFPVPDWTLTGHIAAMDTYGVNYSTLSVSAPGVFFLADDATAAASLARKVNLAMYNYTQTYPKRLGAMCLLPLPHVTAALTELAYCLDTLNFDGVGMYTNSNGTYLGDSTLDPIFSELNTRNATVFVHPAAPGCSGAGLGWPSPMTEYPFDSVRAMENMLLTGQRANYSTFPMIFPHGGGALPYLATRIAGMASLSFMGSFSASETLAQFKSYYFDTASSTSAAQLLALKTFFGGVLKIVTGTDYPYVPTAQASSGLSAIQSNGEFTDSQMAYINNQNVLGIFPKIVSKLNLTSS